MEQAIERELATGQDKIDIQGTMQNDLKASAMGEGEQELFEKKMSKEEKKAAAKAAREAKKKAKVTSQICLVVVLCFVLFDEYYRC